MSSINFAAFGGINGVGSIRGLLATKKFARVIRLKRDAIHAIGRYQTTNIVEPRPKQEQGERSTQHIEFENTFRLEPTNRLASCRGKITAMVQALFDEQLENISYSETGQETKEMSLEFSDYIKNQLLQMGFPRYKFIVMVSIGQIKNQDVRMSSRCLWEPKFDTQFTINYKNKSLFAICVIFGIYHE
ncbi:dynein light chain Tctex-type 5-like [Symsagittifera roscoffensis]|uniref:dynein light chain Tctex-type 5-like n=1 Tax=Symsagittifera roscoffensis TaxID=84072 RepID=UPI00307BEB4C